MIERSPWFRDASWCSRLYGFFASPRCFAVINPRPRALFGVSPPMEVFTARELVAGARRLSRFLLKTVVASSMLLFAVGFIP